MTPGQDLPIDIPAGMTYAQFREQRDRDIAAAIARDAARGPQPGPVENDIPPLDRPMRVTSTRGDRSVPNPNMSTNHPGTDMRPLDGGDANVVASAGGTVVFCGFYSAEMGYAVVIRNRQGGLDFYGHVEKGSYDHLKVDEPVVQGTQLAVMSNSGNAQMGPNNERIKLLHFTRLVPPVTAVPPMLLAGAPETSDGVNPANSGMTALAEPQPLPAGWRPPGLIREGPFKGWRRIDPVFDGQVPSDEMRLQPATEIIANAPALLQEQRMETAVSRFRRDPAVTVPQGLLETLPPMPEGPPYLPGISGGQPAELPETSQSSIPNGSFPRSAGIFS